MPEIEKKVVFFSPDDLAGGSNLKLAKEVLTVFNSSIKTSEINDVIELYHIKLYFDNKLFLLSWSDEEKAVLSEKQKQSFQHVKDLFTSLSNDEIPVLLESLYYQYKNSFWHLLSYFETYKRLQKGTFSSILASDPNLIRHILTEKKIVDYFKDEIKTFLLGFNTAAELLLNSTEKRDRPIKYFFPNTITDVDKEKMVSTYVASEKANLNYLRLIQHARDSDLKLSAKLKLQLQKRIVALNDEILAKGNAAAFGIKAGLIEDQIEPKKIELDGLNMQVTYSKVFLDKRKSIKERFTLFANLFEFVDSEKLISLVNIPNEMNILERLSTASKNEYATGISFQYKSHLSLMELFLFDNYLKQQENSVELLIDKVVTEYLLSFDAKLAFRFNTPSPDASNLERIRSYAPELESLLRQYKLYVEEGELDFELLVLTSSALNFSDIKSLVDKKYVYSTSPEIQRLAFLFFSSQTPLNYIPTLEKQYETFYHLIANEQVTIEQFENYQKEHIQQLINEDVLQIDSDGFIRIANAQRLFIVGRLHQVSVLSYWRYPLEIQNEIDILVSEKLLFFENTLFTKPELDYLNFYLNKKTFTNGMDIRNKYLHGSNNASENAQQNDYYILLRILILILLKIEDDLIIRHSLNLQRAQE